MDGENWYLARSGLTPRTQISAINLEILNEMYDSGMDSKGKGCDHLHQEAVEKTGLPLQVIKDWIGNKKKLAMGRKYQYEKTNYTKGMTAYNCFVREKKENFAGISDWAPAWSQLSAEEKSSYKEKAKKHTITDKPKAAKSLLKKIAHEVTEISLYGVDLVVIGFNRNNGNQVFFGESKTSHFFHSRPKVMEELYAFHIFATESQEVKVDLKELRKKAQLHMNDLYSKAVGKNMPFPYKKVQDGHIIVNGLHESLLPLKTVSCYGEKNLELLLSVESITVDIPTPDFVLAGTEIGM